MRNSTLTTALSSETFLVTRAHARTRTHSKNKVHVFVSPLRNVQWWKEKSILNLKRSPNRRQSLGTFLEGRTKIRENHIEGTVCPFYGVIGHGMSWRMQVLCLILGGHNKGSTLWVWCAQQETVTALCRAVPMLSHGTLHALPTQ